MAERTLSRERLRRRREALLLELGGLVYELHRHGRRAPELLQRKAAELETLESEPAADETDVNGNNSRKRQADEPGGACPSCGAAIEPGQLVCLECGARLGLGRAGRNVLGAVAVVVAVVVIGAAAFGFALSELTSGSSDDDGEQAAQQPPAPSAEGGAEQTQTEAPPETQTEAPPETQTEAPPETQPEPDRNGRAQRPRRSLLLEWPRDLTAHTVVLVTTSDRAAARRLAREAAQSGIEAGLVRADDYDLGSGLWIVFAGRFDTRRGAVRQAANLEGRFPGAYVQLLEPVG